MVQVNDKKIKKAYIELKKKFRAQILEHIAFMKKELIEVNGIAEDEAAFVFNLILRGVQYRYIDAPMYLWEQAFIYVKDGIDTPIKDIAMACILDVARDLEHLYEADEKAARKEKRRRKGG